MTTTCCSVLDEAGACVPKETCNMSKETYIISKETYNMSEETNIMSKETYTM